MRVMEAGLGICSDGDMKISVPGAMQGARIRDAVARAISMAFTRRRGRYSS